MSFFEAKKNKSIFASVNGGMAEWSNAAVLKTVEGHTSGGSNPSSSANTITHFKWVIFFKFTQNLICEKIGNQRLYTKKYK